MRYFIQIQYVGTNYHGWQIQPNAVTVQSVLSDKIQLILGEKVTLVGQGRTDTGVHAKAFFAHFDFNGIIEPNFLSKLNRFLPTDIAVLDILPVKENAHARFSAIARSYEYHLHFTKNPFLDKKSFFIYKKLDFLAMQKAADILKLYQDFSCFSKSRTQVFTNFCTIENAFWENIGNERAVFRIAANRFLRNMVRAITGTLLDVGFGVRSPDSMHDIIIKKNRGNAGESVPAHGLYLTEVKYPKEIWLKNE